MHADDPIDLLLPDAAQTMLLAAALRTGAEGADSWRRWHDGSGGVAALLVSGPDGPKRLLPLLAAAQAAHVRGDVSNAATCLRTALVRERARWSAFADAAGTALDALDAAGVPFVVLRGLAAASTVYPEPALRHCHDVDLLVVGAEARAAASTALDAAGLGEFHLAGSTATRVHVHDGGLPIRVHAELLDLRGWSLPCRELVERGRAVTVLGRPRRVLAPDDALLHGLAHAAASPGRGTLAWVADAWFTIAGHPELDLARLSVTATAAGLRPIVDGQLRWLSALGAPLAPRSDGPVAIDFAARETIIAAAGAGPRGTLGALLGAARGPWRLPILKWMLLPRRDLLLWAHRHGPRRSVAALRWARPIRGLLRRTVDPGDAAGPGLTVGAGAPGRAA